MMLTVFIKSFSKKRIKNVYLVSKYERNPVYVVTNIHDLNLSVACTFLLGIPDS